MVTRHRALVRLTRHSKTLIHPSCRGTMSFWILGFLSDQARLSVVGRTTHELTTRAYKVMRYWGFERWSGRASLPVCFWLIIRALGCCSHLARPCEVFHSWDGKTCDTLIDRSHDVPPESGDTIEIVTSTGVRKCDRSGIYDWSRIYDRSRDVPAL
jgi:hypothetical protein